MIEMNRLTGMNDIRLADTVPDSQRLPVPAEPESDRIQCVTRLYPVSTITGQLTLYDDRRRLPYAAIDDLRRGLTGTHTSRKQQSEAGHSQSRDQISACMSDRSQQSAS